MKVKSIYVNLPVKDLERSRKFWGALGFGFNEQFSNEKGIALVLNEGAIWAMLLKEDFFQTFTNRPLANGSTTQVLNAVEIENREDVDRMIQLALENGGSTYGEPRDHGWMYQNSFADPDGHQWEFLWSDISLLK